MKHVFTTPRTVIIMMLGWGIVCYAAEMALTHQSISQVMSPPKDHGLAASDKPHIVITMNHLCCSGCASDVKGALKELPWVGELQVSGVESMEDANKAAEDSKLTLDGARNKIEFDVKQEDVPKIDFVALDAALRSTGLTADRIDFVGVQHYRLEAEFKHVCCSLCAHGLEAGLAVARNLRASGTFGWIDSVAANKMAHSVTIHARYGASADLEELLLTLNKMGFQAQALKVKVGSET